ncbi:WPP domain-interacting tail-anchored protein 1 isoform X2 [Rosa chinensis]|uniref:WPP domain-interacting tail-anchored protein 1 isoform X2 n=1 Tax=Rosa chinensis TaxID=74649 RepID=UPI001AD9063C|nr:WPP domain-interacting tail-anchored protein 1 isoform X2 [Rosa chinensis]
MIYRVRKRSRVYGSPSPKGRYGGGRGRVLPRSLLGCNLCHDCRFQNHLNSCTVKMDYDATHEASDFGNDVNIDVPVVESNRVDSLEKVSFDGMVIEELQNLGEVITGVELDLACAYEKLLNLIGFMMHVATKESDFDAFISDEEQTIVGSVEKALEFTLLSGILDSEDSEQSLKQLQEQISEIRMQSLKFQRTLSCFDGEENWNNNKGVLGHLEDDIFSSKNVLMKMQTVKHQRHILRMLDKSLAREMDLEKKLTESKQIEEDLKLRLLSSEQEAYCMEDEISEMRNVVTDLKEKESKVEDRARNAEAKYKLLAETNTELNEELRLLKTRLTELTCGCNMPWQLLRLGRRNKTC